MSKVQIRGMTRTMFYRDVCILQRKQNFHEKRRQNYFEFLSLRIVLLRGSRYLQEFIINLID